MLNHHTPWGPTITARLAACALLVAIIGLAPAKGEEPGKKEVLIKTPWCSLEATDGANLTGLDLPLYPGAKPVRDEGGSGSAYFNLTIKGSPSIRFLAGKFRTPDSFERVREFYTKNLGKQVTKFSEPEPKSKCAFELKGKSLFRAVELETAQGATEIKLVRIEGVNAEVK